MKREDYRPAHEERKNMRAEESHQYEIKGRHMLNRVYDVLPLHYPVIDFISDKRYDPCLEFNRGICQAPHPHRNEKETEGKKLDAICDICCYALNLNNPHPYYDCKIVRGLENALNRRNQK